MLLGGRKFDIRFYALVAGSPAADGSAAGGRVWAYRNSYVRTCSAQYDAGNVEDMYELAPLFASGHALAHVVAVMTLPPTLKEIRTLLLPSPFGSKVGAFDQRCCAVHAGQLRRARGQQQAVV